MAQHDSRIAGPSIVANECVAKLHTVTRLLVGRMLVNQEQKEPDIVSLSWCSEASNTFRVSCICTSDSERRPETIKDRCSTTTNETVFVCVLLA